MSSIVSNNPEAVATQFSEIKESLELDIKMNILKDISLSDIQKMVAFIKNGGLNTAAANGGSAPDTFDDIGRNYSRMVRKATVMTNGGHEMETLRPFTNTLAEARAAGSDWYDPINETWVLRGVKRQRDYPENTAKAELDKLVTVISASGRN